MAWTETDPMKERMHFVADWDRELYAVTELCARYGISRKTGYKWIARYVHAGVAGRAEQSRAPHRCPHRIAPAVAAAIVGARRQHPSWGPQTCLTENGRECPFRHVVPGLTLTVTRPAFLVCLNCRWLPSVTTNPHPSASMRRMTSRTFTSSDYQVRLPICLRVHCSRRPAHQRPRADAPPRPSTQATL